MLAEVPQGAGFWARSPMSTLAMLAGRGGGLPCPPAGSHPLTLLHGHPSLFRSLLPSSTPGFLEWGTLSSAASLCKARLLSGSELGVSGDRPGSQPQSLPDGVGETQWEPWPGRQLPHPHPSTEADLRPPPSITEEAVGATAASSPLPAAAAAEPAGCLGNGRRRGDAPRDGGVCHRGSRGAPAPRPRPLKVPESPPLPPALAPGCLASPLHPTCSCRRGERPPLPAPRGSDPFVMSLLPGPSPQLSFPATAHSSPASGHPCTGRQIWGGVWWGASGSRAGTWQRGRSGILRGRGGKAPALGSWKGGRRLCRADRVGPGLKGGLHGRRAEPRGCLGPGWLPRRAGARPATPKVHPLLHHVLTFFPQMFLPPPPGFLVPFCRALSQPLPSS